MVGLDFAVAGVACLQASSNGIKPYSCRIGLHDARYFGEMRKLLMIRIRYHAWQHNKCIKSGSFQVVKLQIATYKYKVHLPAIDGLAVCLSGSFVWWVCDFIFLS